MNQTSATQQGMQYSGAPRHAAHHQSAKEDAPARLSLLVQDFLSMVLMVRRGCEAQSVETFLQRVEEYFQELEARALASGYTLEQYRDGQYALCAFLDESVLAAGESNIRRHIELYPLQYKYFGVHLAGEGFFERLETLRSDIKGNLDVLEVYHLCLALGFEGKFRLEHRDQLRYIANTLGQDLARYRPVPAELSPSWRLPDQVGQLLRHEVPVWVYLVLIALFCGVAFLVLDGLLDTRVDALIERLPSLFETS